MRKHKEPALPLFWGPSLPSDKKAAKLLINELGESPDAKELKQAVHKLNVSIFTLFVTFLGLGVLFMIISDIIGSTI